MRLALGRFLGLRPLGGGGGADPIEQMIAHFQERVTTDGGTNEGSSCLTAILNFINDIS